MELTHAQIKSEIHAGHRRGIKFDCTQADIDAYRRVSRIGQPFKVSRRDRDFVYNAILAMYPPERITRQVVKKDTPDYEPLLLARRENSGMDV